MTCRRWLVSILCLLIAGLVACGGATPPPPTTPPTPEQEKPPQKESVDPLRLHGSNTLGAELAPKMLQAFFKENGIEASRQPGTTDVESIIEGSAGDKTFRANVVAEGTGEGFRALLEGKADIVLASRRIRPEERNDFIAKGVGDLMSEECEHVVGLDAIALIVHTGNPVHALRMHQVQDIFNGKVDDWQEVGGLPGDITIYARGRNSGTYNLFRRLVLGGEEIEPEEPRWIDSEDLAEYVASDKGRIGFVGSTHTGKTRALGIIPGEGKEPVHPNRFSIASEDYPLSRRLYFYVLPHAKHPLAKDFLSFALGDQGQKLVREAGFVDLAVSMSSEAPWCGDKCPKEYKAVAEKAKRLSATFRFERRSSNLDTRALEDLDRVARFLKGGEPGAIHLMGFSDSVPFEDEQGKEGANDRISLARAETVKKALAQLGVYKVETHGFGEAIPVASNDTVEGRDRNRRVEIWVEIP